MQLYYIVSYCIMLYANISHLVIWRGVACYITVWHYITFHDMVGCCGKWSCMMWNSSDWQHVWSACFQFMSDGMIGLMLFCIILYSTVLLSILDRCRRSHRFESAVSPWTHRTKESNQSCEDSDVLYFRGPNNNQYSGPQNTLFSLRPLY